MYKRFQELFTAYFVLSRLLKTCIKPCKIILKNLEAFLIHSKLNSINTLILQIRRRNVPKSFII